jgi:hypothetical protein
MILGVSFPYPWPLCGTAEQSVKGVPDLNVTAAFLCTVAWNIQEGGYDERGPYVFVQQKTYFLGRDVIRSAAVYG